MKTNAYLDGLRFTTIAGAVPAGRSGIRIKSRTLTGLRIKAWLVERRQRQMWRALVRHNENGKGGK